MILNSPYISGSLTVTNLSGSGVRYLMTSASGLLISQTADAAIKNTYTASATAGQTVFPVTNGYSTGLVDVYLNGTKLASSDYSDADGVNITLVTGSDAGDLLEFVKYSPALGVTNNALRQLTTFTSSEGQTVYSASYTPGLLDVYYNGSRLTPAEYTANNGTYITLATGSSAGDIIDMLVYSYQVGAFSGVGGTGTANQVAYWDTTNSITGSPNFTVSGSTLAVTGSFTVITGSTAEFTVNPTGVRIGNVSTDTHTITGSVNMSGSFSTIGTITAQTLVVQTVTSSVSFITGSTRFGTLSSNTHLFTGSMSVTGGLVDINKDGQSLRIFPATSSGSARIQMQNSGSGGLAGANAIIAVESSTGADQFTGTSPFSFVIGTATQKAFHLGANSAVVMTITGSNVGIGTSSPQMPLSVQANTGNGAIRLIGTSNASSNNAGIYWYDSNDSTFNGYLGNFSTSFDIYNQRSTPMAFYTAGTERMRITSAGYTKISNTGGFANTSATAHHIQNDFNNDNIIYMVHAGTSPYGPWINFSAASPNNTTNYFLTCQDSTQSKIIIYSNGNIVNRNGSYGTLSDITLKENIVDATPKLNDLLQLKVRNFNMIGFEEKQIGFIAQEFEEVFPKMIDIDGKTGMKTIKTSVLVPMLVKALQEANAKITALEEKLERNNIQ